MAEPTEIVVRVVIDNPAAQHADSDLAETDWPVLAAAWLRALDPSIVEREALEAESLAANGTECVLAWLIEHLDPDGRTK